MTDENVNRPQQAAHQHLLRVSHLPTIARSPVWCASLEMEMVPLAGFLATRLAST